MINFTGAGISGLSVSNQNVTEKSAFKFICRETNKPILTEFTRKEALKNGVFSDRGYVNLGKKTLLTSNISDFCLSIFQLFNR